MQDVNGARSDRCSRCLIGNDVQDITAFVVGAVADGTAGAPELLNEPVGRPVRAFVTRVIRQGRGCGTRSRSCWPAWCPRSEVGFRVDATATAAAFLPAGRVADPF
jgi:hypothetical protein